MHAVVGSSVADTIYAIDRVTDDALQRWFAEHWPPDEPVELVSEALDAPVRVGDGPPRWTCIVDPVDGTRSLMYDKRSAWVLAAVAPWSAGPRLRDTVAAAMTELPTTKQWASDQVSTVRGAGPGGIVAVRRDVRRTGWPGEVLVLRPSTATGLEHGFASLARFFPQGKARIAAFEEELWRELYGHGDTRRDVAIFDDQYLATGGQFMELLSGHDRFLGDVRPLVFAELGWSSARWPATRTTAARSCCSRRPAASSPASTAGRSTHRSTPPRRWRGSASPTARSPTSCNPCSPACSPATSRPASAGRPDQPTLAVWPPSTGQHDAGDERGLVRGEEQRGVGDVPRRALAAERHGRRARVGERLARSMPRARGGGVDRHGRVDEARA